MIIKKLEFEHTPVLLNEVISNLKIQPAGIYIDATFGRGGHSREILKHLDDKGLLLCIDKDPEAINVAKELKSKQVLIRHGSFTQIKNWCDEIGFTGKVSGILLDLGVSSPQLDDPKRGFSFLHDGPLDMRMNTMQTFSAADWINSAKEKEIADVLFEYGEERFSRRIAKAIVYARKESEIKTTGCLAEVVKKANPKWEKNKHPATRTFQAIRIFINNELGELNYCLGQCLEVLEVGGRLLVISFHSLEDRIVKQFMRTNAGKDSFPKRVPLRYDQIRKRLKILGRGIHASPEEVGINPRARSAVLRVMEKIT